MDEYIETLAKDLRDECKETEKRTRALMDDPVFRGEQAFAGQHGEMKAQIMLAVRHLEDARMRMSETTNTAQAQRQSANSGCLKRLVRVSDLRFPVDTRWEPRKSWFARWIARCASAMILNHPVRTYQFGGWNGALNLSYERVLADKEQLAHWILRTAGYSCCPADLMKLTGQDPAARNTNTKGEARVARKEKDHE